MYFMYSLHELIADFVDESRWDRLQGIYASTDVVTGDIAAGLLETHLNHEHNKRNINILKYLKIGRTKSQIVI